MFSDVKPTIKDIFTLVLISALSGFFLALPVGAVSAALHFAHPVQLALITWLCLQACSWLLLLSRWSRMLYLLEDKLRVDVNRDGAIGEPERLEPVRVELLQDGGKHVELIDLPASQEQLIALAGALMAGASLAESSWTGAGALFSRSEFHRLRDEMIRRGLLRWQNPRAPAQGLMLSPGGKACMRHFASMAKQERIE